MTDVNKQTVKKSRSKVKNTSASAVLDESNSNFVVEKVLKKKIETISLSELYTYFKFCEDMCKYFSESARIAIDYNNKENSKKEYHKYFDIKSNIKNEIIKRLEEVLND